MVFQKKNISVPNILVNIAVVVVVGQLTDGAVS